MTCSPRLTLSPLVAALVLAGCATDSLFESRKIDYKNAHPTSTLEVPPDLTAPTRNDRFAVPDVSPRGTATFSDYKAERVEQSNRGDIEVLPASAQMRIERAGSQRWLVVPGTPGNIWPQIRDFWLELGFILNIDSPEIGVLETDWAENRANIPQDFLRSLLGRVIDGLYSTPERDKFRTRIEAGKDGTVEIYISHRGMLEVYTSETAREGTTVWQPRPADPELEAEMLRRLMVRLGADETHAQAVLASAPQVERAQLQETDGQTR
ncbi:MAG: outer membrane protein assembly factor BamC, partial [Azoarcus sp.]|nr:outer membrane protein assembly factor BamC [Azoarcus sp.]